jgi:hypothetical protein
VALKWSEWDEEEGKDGKEVEEEAEAPVVPAPAPLPAPAGAAAAASLAPPALTAELRARLHVGSPGVTADANFVEESWD